MISLILPHRFLIQIQKNLKRLLKPFTIDGYLEAMLATINQRKTAFNKWTCVTNIGLLFYFCQLDNSIKMHNITITKTYKIQSLSISVLEILRQAVTLHLSFKLVVFQH